MHRIYKGILLLLFQPILVSGQHLDPQGEFMTDSVQVGEEFKYTLSVKYPTRYDVVFPDSTYDYTPFELNRKIPYPTITHDSLSTDSAVYYFTTFEVDSIQYLRLPVFLISDGDSIPSYPPVDSVILNHVVTEIPDSLALIQNTIMRPVSYQFNYPYFLIGTGIIAIIALVVIIFYGKRITNRVRLYFLRKRHKKFLTKFSQLISRKDMRVEPIVVFWKRYMEKLDDIPYTKMTTKEILSYRDLRVLKTPLNIIDRAIYAKMKDERIGNSLADLRDFSTDRFFKKVEELKNG